MCICIAHAIINCRGYNAICININFTQLYTRNCASFPWQLNKIFCVFFFFVAIPFHVPFNEMVLVNAAHEMKIHICDCDSGALSGHTFCMCMVDRQLKIKYRLIYHFMVTIHTFHSFSCFCFHWDHDPLSARITIHKLLTPFFSN